MKWYHNLHAYLLVALLPVLLLFYLSPAEKIVFAADLRQQHYSFSVSRNVLSFVGVDGGPNPRPQWFGIINTGSEPIHWSVSVDGNSPWLNVVPASGLDDGAVRVSVDATALVSGTLQLTPGTFTETLTVSAQETMGIEVISVTLVVTSTVTPMYAENFQVYTAGSDPVDWLDTDADNSLAENDGLFEIFDLGEERVFGTESTLSNIHSHYVGDGSDTFSSYEYTGRLMMTAANSGIGVTFLSQYPQADAYYRLRRYGSGSFHLSPHGTTISGGTTDTGVVPDRNVWYLFRVQVEDIGTRTEIKAKVWAEGTTEPAGWQVDCYDASPTRLAAGTVGVWSHTSGNKYWDDLAVNPLPPEPDESPPFAYGHDPAPGAANVDPSSSIVVHVTDSRDGIDVVTLAMTVAGVPVTPTIAGNLFDYTLTYDPPMDFGEGDVVMVTVDACDLAVPTNCMDTEVYSFTIWTLPVIDVWYGSHQVFGHLGNPQQWVNILGNVSDPDGMASLTYSLNGGPESPLSIGPDARRLASEGDFTIEIAYTDLISGSNQVVITATDDFSNQAVETVTVEYVSGNVWPRPYSIDWSSVEEIQDMAQIVDGLWTLEADSIRPVVLGYDRIIAIGDMTWDDYAVTVPITIHGVDPVYEYPSNGAGVGILMRWNGHVDWDGSQPRYGWYPMGGMGWYAWESGGSNRLCLFGNRARLIAQDTSRTLDLGVAYNFKMRVETIPDQGGLYSLKVWEASEPEPPEWDFFGQEGLDDPQNGSLLLMAHHVDASFGDVTITPGPFDDTIPPIISDIQLMRRETSATIAWVTNEPATSSVAFGLSPVYENGSVTDDMLVTQHAITLTGLISQTLYHYQVTSVDGSGNASSSADLTFKTSSVLPNIVSDDFNTCSLNTDLWEFIDPYQDDPFGRATLAMTGTHTPDAWLSISVPAGVSHDVWTGGNLAPRVMQPADDTDFEIVVRFESGLSRDHQMQGILVEQDSGNLLRFDFHSYDSNTRIFAASFINGTPSTRVLSAITDTNVVPLYMRVEREGDQWTLSYSYDGENWTTSGSFVHPLTVTAVGPFVGNSGSSPPAHTALIDYFFNTASPITAEDGDWNTISINLVGNGMVVPDPERPPYSCGQVVTLTAMGDPGWTFDSWSGDLTGNTNPATLIMTGSRVITATFTQDAYTLMVNVDGEGTVIVEPDQPTYIYGDVVTLTAAAAPGWNFSGWSGDLVQSVDPVTLTITDNQAVTATFTQDTYILKVHKIGAGTVIVEPDRPTYVYGDVVMLTAMADPGWSFSGWSSDLVGSTNPVTLVITGNRVVTATFTVSEADAYEIFLPCVARRRER